RGTIMSEMTIPIIRIWDVLLVPLQGEIGDEAAERLRENVLQRIYQSGAEGLIIDVTGLWLIDSHLSSLLSRTVAAAALMGTRTVICGMRAEVALTLQTMGLELQRVACALTLEQALLLLGIQTVRTLDDEANSEEEPALTAPGQQPK